MAHTVSGYAVRYTICSSQRCIQTKQVRQDMDNFIFLIMLKQKQNGLKNNRIEGLRLSPLGTAATLRPTMYVYSRGGLQTAPPRDHPWSIVLSLRPTIPGPDDRWRLWCNRWNANWQGKPKYWKKTCPSATLSTTNPTWRYLGHRGGKPANNRLSYGTANQTDCFYYKYKTWIIFKISLLLFKVVSF
jgi:hypothetical protein